ncbi:MAG: hypothetical protein OXN92_00505 [Gammaproteobacteria bacterium]|nr:hypothetical protein [Gammaproteobacteria bacterium]
MPSADAVIRALALIEKRAINHAYFFAQLDSPDWIEPLRDAGLFRNPPAPRIDGDLISYPPWPESEYLARMASRAPEKVGATILRIPTTENTSVHENLARAAVHLPVEMAVQWAVRETEWLSQQQHIHWPIAEALGPVIEHLCQSGQIETAISLARSLLELRLVVDPAPSRSKPPQDHESDAGTSDGGSDGEDALEIETLAAAVAARLSSRAVSRIDVFEYEEFVREYVPILLKHGGIKAFSMLCDLIEKLLHSDIRSGSYPDSLSRPAIEPHAQNYGHDVSDILIDAVRDGSIELVDSGIDMRSVSAALEGRNGGIFKRILLHLAAEQTQRHPAFAIEVALCEDHFLDERLLHEYSRLLGAAFPILNKSQTALVLGWIQRGPSFSDSFAGDDEERRKWRLYWQVRRLAWIRDHLDDDWSARYALIVGEVGEPEHPDFTTYTTTGMGPTSPVGVTYLEGMSTAEIAAYLGSWEPTGDPMSADRAGLADVFERVVAGSPSRFLAESDSFLGLPVPFVEALVAGVREAVRADRVVEWAEVVVLLSRILARHPTSREWRHARLACIRLVEEGLQNDVIDIGLREGVWAIIDSTARDPDPSPEEDAEPTNDVANKSIGCVRGNALHAVIHYALWVYRMGVGGSARDTTPFGMNAIPEVRTRLERNLDPAIEPSPSVRAVYGQWFPHLTLLDEKWSAQHVESIFPDRYPKLRDAAWETYLRFCPVYSTPFELLREQYSAAVDRLPSSDEGASAPRGEPNKRLGEHLLIMAGRGSLAWGDDDALLRRYFENATPDDSRRAIGLIGRDLTNEESEVPQDVVERFASLAEELVGLLRAKGRDQMGHLSSLGWWVASGRFSGPWALAQLDRLIDLAGAAEPRFVVMDCLVELSWQYPAKTLAVLGSLARTDQPNRSVFFGRDESVRTILGAALASPAARDEANSVIDQLLAAGHLQFRDLRGPES